MRNLIIRILHTIEELASEWQKRVDKCKDCGRNPYYDPPCKLP